MVELHCSDCEQKVEFDFPIETEYPQILSCLKIMHRLGTIPKDKEYQDWRPTKKYWDIETVESLKCLKNES